MATNIIDKLQKLIKHEESAREIGNIAEAAAFAGRIQDLLTKHQLSMSDIEIQAEVDSGESVDTEIVRARDVGEKAKPHVIEWQLILLRGIARANSCDTLCSTGSNTQFVVGLTADRQKVVALYTYFLKLAQDLMEKAFVEHKTSDEYKAEQAAWAGFWNRGSYLAAYSRTWRRSWLEGFAAEIRNRMYITKREAEKTAEVEAVQSGALIHLRDKAKAVADYMDNGGYKSRRGGRSSTDWNAYSAGQKVGQSVALSGQALGAAS